eukprot:6478641-Amphidinium_carterae.1
MPYGLIELLATSKLLGMATNKKVAVHHPSCHALFPTLGRCLQVVSYQESQLHEQQKEQAFLSRTPKEWPWTARGRLLSNSRGNAPWSVS